MSQPHIEAIAVAMTRASGGWFTEGLSDGQTEELASIAWHAVKDTPEGRKALLDALTADGLVVVDATQHDAKDTCLRRAGDGWKYRRDAQNWVRWPFTGFENEPATPAEQAVMEAL